MNFAFSKTKNNFNEDRCFCCDEFAFVIDGASGISTQKFSQMNSDAEWYAEWWYNYLKKELFDFEIPIHKILEKGIDLIIKDFTNLSAGKVVLDFPSATIDVVRKNKNDQIEIYVLGDSPLLIQSVTGKIILITDNLNILNDEIKIETLNYLSKQESCNFLTTIKNHSEIMNEYRSKKNRVFGYNVLSDDKNAIFRGIYKVLDGNIFKRFILSTDGFSQAFDLLNLYTVEDFSSNLKSVMDAEKIFNQICEVQNNDKDISKFLRIKISDDASICVLDFNK